MCPGVRLTLNIKSTRGDKNYVTASQAIVQGIANDGGLFVPETIPTIDFPLEKITEMSYQELAYEVLKLILTDYTEEELKYCINSAYDEKFDTKLIAPLVSAGNGNFLELFHGKTIAFKDMALSILPHLLTTSAKKNNVTFFVHRQHCQPEVPVPYFRIPLHSTECQTALAM